MVVAVGGKIGDGLMERLEELLGSIEPRDTGLPEPAATPRTDHQCRLFTKQSTRRTSSSERAAIRSGTRTGSRCSC